MGKERNNSAAMGYWPVLPLPLLMSLMIVLHLKGPSQSHESASLLFLLNPCFTTLVSLFIAMLAGHSFLLSGRPALLAITAGMTVWGFSALVSVVGEHVGNYNITIHNLGVFAYGLCHIAGATVALRKSHENIRDPGSWLTLGVGTALCTVGLIWMATLERWLPPFCGRRRNNDRQDDCPHRLHQTEKKRT